MATQHHIFIDQSNTQHQFEVYPRGQIFNDVSGVYMFTKINNDGTHNVLYIGETGSLKNRPVGAGHEKWESAIRRGMTHICVLRTPSRVSIQNKLIQAFNPPLNKE